MDDKLRKLISDATIDMYESLRKSVEEAGGAFDKEQYMNMNVDELISLLCTNGVRFVYNPREKFNNYKPVIETQSKLKYASNSHPLDELKVAFDTIEDLICEIRKKDVTIKQLNKDIDYIKSNSYKNPNPCFCEDSSNLFSDDPQYWIKKQKETIVRQQNKINELEKSLNETKTTLINCKTKMEEAIKENIYLLKQRRSEDKLIQEKEAIVKNQNKIDELQKENNNLQEKLKFKINQLTILIKHCENIEVLHDEIEKWKISYDVINFENEHLNKQLKLLVEQSVVDECVITELKRSNKLMEEQLIRCEQKATNNSFKPLNPSRRVKSFFDNENGV